MERRNRPPCPKKKKKKDFSTHSHRVGTTSLEWVPRLAGSRRQAKGQLNVSCCHSLRDRRATLAQSAPWSPHRSSPNHGSSTENTGGRPDEASKATWSCHSLPDTLAPSVPSPAIWWHRSALLLGAAGMMGWTSLKVKEQTQ